MRNIKRLIAGFAVAGAIAMAPAFAQESLDEVLRRLNDFTASGNYPKALAELEWARRALEKAHHARIEALFPVTLVGLEGKPLERQRLLGLTTYTRRYGDAGTTLEVVLMEGARNAGFAAIEHFSRMLGAEVNAGPVRVDGRDATFVPRDDEGRALVTVRLEAGATLRFSLTGGKAPERVIEAAREFGVATLDAYLAGDNPEVKSRI